MTLGSFERRRLALVVDGDLSTRQLYSDAFTPYRWTILQAESGPEALALAISRHPDVILSETSLRGFDGFTLYDLLHTDVGTSRIPFLFVTADATESNVAAIGCRRRHHQAVSAGSDPARDGGCDRSQQKRPSAIRGVDLEGRAAVGRVGDADRTRRRAAAHAQEGAPARRHDGTTFASAAAALRLVRCRVAVCAQPCRRRQQQASEQWDYFICPAGCGDFEYRVRTRKLRKVPA